MKSLSEEKFSDFYEKWVTQLKEYLSLVVISNDDDDDDRQVPEPDYEDLVTKLTAHHKEYYTVKWAAAHEDVMPFFSPVWLSSLENAYVWFTGWKPCMLFHLINSLRRTQPGLMDLTEEQMRRLEALRSKIKREEKKVERDMERLQVSVAERRMVELARLSFRVNKKKAKAEADAKALAEAKAEAEVVDGLVNAALKVLAEGLEKVMKTADCVRLKALKGVLDVLSAKQSVELLSATSLLQIQLSKLGEKRDKAVSKNESW